MNESRPVRMTVWLALAVLLALVFAGNRYWLRAHPLAYGGPDETHHCLRGLLIHDALWKPGKKLWLEEGVEWINWWPPLVYFTSAVSLRLLGRTAQMLALTGTFFFLVLLLLTYGIGAWLRSPPAGLLAAALLAAWPVMLDYSRHYNLDLPLAACVAGAAYFLLRSQGFTKPGAALGFGLWSGLGMLTKVTFPVFLAPIFIVEMWIHRRERTRRAWLWCGLSFLIAAGLAAVWYVPRLDHLWHSMRLHLVGYNRYFAPGQAESGHFFLIDAYYSLGPGGAALLLLGLFFGLTRNGNRSLLAWLLFPLILFAAAPSDIVRFALPSLAAAAVSAACWATGKPVRRRRPAVLALVGLVFLVPTAINHTFSPRLTVPDPAPPPPPAVHMPGAGVWTKAILADSADRPAPRVCYLQTSRDSVFNEEYAWYVLLLSRPDVRFTGFGPFHFHYQDYRRLIDCLARADVLVHRYDIPGADWPTRKALADVVLAADKLALREDEGLAKGLYPPDFAFAEWPATPPAVSRKTFISGLTEPPGDPPDGFAIYLFPH